MEKDQKLGLVLSGGGARGFAHLGVLEAFEDFGLRPDIISGTSAGAIAGVFYANGYHPREILDILMQRNFISYTRLSLSRGRGFMKLSGVKKLMKDKLTVKNIEDLDIPFVICVTNMNKGVSEYFASGPIIDAVLASSSIPVIFQLIKINGTLYADGGVLNNLPVDGIKDKAELIFGINVTPPAEEDDLGSVLQIAERSFHLSISANINTKVSLCDHYIEMPELMNYSLLKSSNGKKIYEIGYNKTKEYLRDHGRDLKKAL
ncbi:MAG: patatin-like phospholipase family protein [Bacteroidales bacterium]